MMRLIAVLVASVILGGCVEDDQASVKENSTTSDEPGGSPSEPIRCPEGPYDHGLGFVNSAQFEVYVSVRISNDSWAYELNASLEPAPSGPPGNSEQSHEFKIPEGEFKIEASNDRGHTVTRILNTRCGSTGATYVDVQEDGSMGIVYAVSH